MALFEHRQRLHAADPLHHPHDLVHRLVFRAGLRHHRLRHGRPGDRPFAAQLAQRQPYERRAAVGKRVVDLVDDPLVIGAQVQQIRGDAQRVGLGRAGLEALRVGHQPQQQAGRQRRRYRQVHGAEQRA